MRDALARFAVNLEMWWTDQPPIDRVASAAEAGFSQAEIWHWPNWDVKALGDACRRSNITITQIGGWDFEPRMNEPANHADFLQAIEQAATVAHQLGAHRINVNGPYLEPGEDVETVRSGIVECLRKTIPVLDGSGLTLMVEPMNLRVDHAGYSLPTSHDVIDVCQQVDSGALGINWDLYHLQISEGDLTGHFSEGLPWVAYVQIADHPGRNEPGTGEINYANVLRTVDELGYSGPIGLECSPRDSAGTAVERLISLAQEAGLTRIA